MKNNVKKNFKQSLNLSLVTFIERKHFKILSLFQVSLKTQFKNNLYFYFKCEISENTYICYALNRPLFLMHFCHNPCNHCILKVSFVITI